MTDRTPTEATLLPCPFCGAPAALTDTMPGGAYWCHCTICECEGPASSKDAATAISAWNRRASPPAPAAEPVAWAVYWQGGLWALCETKREAVCEAGDLEPKGEARSLYTHPIDAAAIRAEARREALAQAIAAAKGCAWVAFNEEEAKACEVLLGDIVETIRALADKGEAE